MSLYATATYYSVTQCSKIPKQKLPVPEVYEYFII